MAGVDTPARSDADTQTKSEWDEVRGAVVHLSSGVWAGIISGVIIGGSGGRLAMFVLRVTSDPSLHGLQTDDDFKIGSFTGATIFLLALCTAAGVAGGLFYLLVRGWLPERRRPLYNAIFWGSVGGAMVIEPGGIDFTRVEPHALSIALFILLPALYGAAVSTLTERFLRRKEGPLAARRVLAFLPLLGLAVLGPFGIIVLAAGFLGWTLNRRYPVTALWRSEWIERVGRVGLAGITVVALVTLTGDISEIL